MTTKYNSDFIKKEVLSDQVIYNPVFQRPDRAIGVGATVLTLEEALADLRHRDEELNERDIHQFIRVTSVEWKGIR